MVSTGSTGGDGLLDATETTVAVGRLQLARVRGTSHVVERNAAMVRTRPADAVAVYLSLEGEALFYHDDGVLTRQPGQAVVCDADRPFVRGFSRGLEELVVKVPRDVFAAATGLEEVPEPVLVDFGSGSRANAFAHALARQVDRTVRDDATLAPGEDVLLGLLGQLMTPGREATSVTHLAAAKAYVDAHLGDSGLSATRIADAVGVSPRHLSRVFAEQDLSVPRYVSGRRLDAARSLLVRPSADPLSVAEVAHRVGFSSAAHFSNAFTARFGERASDVRRGGAVARACAA